MYKRQLLVTVARLAEQKGLPTLLDAVAQLTDLPIRAVVAGDGPLRAGLESDIAGRALPVHLLGRRDDIADLLAAADVVVVPSLWEGQPLIVQEALAAGAAIVATDAGGTGEVAGDAAVLVPAQDPVALVVAVRGLIEDPARRAVLQDRARRRAVGLPTDADALEQVIAVYRGLKADSLESRGAADI